VTASGADAPKKSMLDDSGQHIERRIGMAVFYLADELG
jgi:hypothetical protein